jgi:hypothetical protein
MADSLDRSWMLPVRATPQATDPSRARDPAAGDAEWHRAIAIAEEADRGLRAAQMRGSGVRGRREWVKPMAGLAYTLILASGWFLYLWHPRFPTGSRFEIPDDQRLMALVSPIARAIPDPHAVRTGDGQTRTFALPGNTVATLRPGSEFIYPGAWAPAMTAWFSDGEVILDVPTGTVWTVYGVHGAVVLDPGRYALYDDRESRALRISVAAGRAIWEGDTVTVVPAAVVRGGQESGLSIVSDTSGFPRPWGIDAVSRSGQSPAGRASERTDPVNPPPGETAGAPPGRDQ